MKTYIKGKSKAKHKNIIRAFHPTSGSPNRFKKPNDPPPNSKKKFKHLLMLHHQ
jgi:hypothetical protein